MDVNEELKFFVKMQTKIGGGGGSGSGWSQGECERRIEVLRIDYPKQVSDPPSFF